MDNEITLSVIVPTYNHEKYIYQALDSIFKQKTKYKYEVLVGEDASTDKTKNEIKRFDKDHPGFLTIFFRERNMRSGVVWNATDLRHRAKGKYLITLEGDDFWINDSKIEKQINILENNPEVFAVAHNCIVVDENSNLINESYPDCKNYEYSVDDFCNGILAGQTATIMCRNYLLMGFDDYDILEKRLLPGDRLNNYYYLTHGKVVCIQEALSAYRHITNGGSSYSANEEKFSFERDELWWRELLRYSKMMIDYKTVKYCETKYLLTLLRGLKYKKLSFWEFCSMSKRINHFSSSLISVLLKKYN